MDAGARPMSAMAIQGAAPGPAGPMTVARVVGQMMLLPWNVLACMAAAGLSRLADEVRLTVSGGGERRPAPPTAVQGDAGTLALPPAVPGNAGPTSGAVNASAATIMNKETKMSYEDPCGDAEDCQIRLYSYTIVTIRRGAEAILYRGAKLVTDPMDQCEFDAWVIAEYLQSPEYRKAQDAKNADHRPIVDEADKRWLRVSSEIQHTWGKQPLHYQEKQLRLLERIANGINPPAN